MENDASAPPQIQSPRSIPGHHVLVNAPGNISPRIKCRTRIGEKSLQFVGSKLWCQLPTDLKNCGSYNIFKRNYKKSLLGLPESENNGQWIFISDLENCYHPKFQRFK